MCWPPSLINYVLIIVYSECLSFVTQAEIDSDMLTIALEPEAAALYVKYLPVERRVDGNDKEVLQAFAPGSKYIVVDAGGWYIIIAKLLRLIWNFWFTTETCCKKCIKTVGTLYMKSQLISSFLSLVL